MCVYFWLLGFKWEGVQFVDGGREVLVGGCMWGV